MKGKENTISEFLRRASSIGVEFPEIRRDGLPIAFDYPHVHYAKLNARQQENYNFQKVSAHLADYGFSTMRLTADWQGADFIAQSPKGEFLPVQLKGRLTIARKYERKGLWLCFPDGADWYLGPHDVLRDRVMMTIHKSASWTRGGVYSFPKLSKEQRETLSPFRLVPRARRK